ncbi:hypothetical protein P3602_21140 [Vibrio parahaemolyticus]|uniref:hypothetical protein n=1 Tax=Vibrio TaxID=662 RepID=UPI001CDC44B5|nr:MULTISPECIES: hypothetical protein [Vibrio]MCA2421845.1 hypothetical protein [Vibrio alginolyticus]MCA2446547.1 hypothetical protein [Vibrio alginolyticus]MCR9821593.1 hypothetical protein [Vibrio parahaemolyticus]MDF5108324.1 hypothetical protein [Vibrio parahaemolyticus]MDF5143230.1 hypothetical protein [Vibrio parahaemolyticus]
MIDTVIAKGINPDMTTNVLVSPLPAELKQKIVDSGLCLPNRCFDNSWSIVMNDLFPGAEYVLAFACRVLPVEHSIICVNGKYYDPTWELHLGNIGTKYVMLAKWSKKELPEVAKKAKGHDGYLYPPMVRFLETSHHFNKLFLRSNVCKV